MSLYRKKLDDGLFYNHLQTDRFKTVYFSVNFILPLEEETAAQYTVLPMILQRGCEEYPTRRALARRLEELYGAAFGVRNTKSGESRIINFSLSMIDDAYLPAGEDLDVLGDSLALLEEVLLRPLTENGTFLPAYTDSEIRNAIDNKRAVINNKQQYAYERCIASMFDGERYSIPSDGKLEYYENITPADLVVAHREMLARARVEIFYIGSAAPETIEPLATRIFLQVDRAYTEIPCVCTHHVPAKEVRHIEETTTAEQGKLVMGFCTDTVIRDTDATAMTLLNEIYGGSPASKLFMNVRERMSLCYSCSTVNDLQKGVMFVLAGIDNNNLDITVQETLKQLDNIQQGKITKEELQCAKQSLVSAYQSLPDSAEAMKSWYLRRIISDTLAEPEISIQDIEKLQIGDVVRVAQKIQLDTVYFLKGDNSAIYGEADEVEEE